MEAGDMSTESEARRTTLYEEHREAGGKLVDFAGWVLPVRYSGVVEEHLAVRRAAGLFDVSHMGEFRVSGPEAASFLQRMTPNDVADLTAGQAHYSALLSEAGTYLDDLLVYRLADQDFLLVVNAANRAGDFAWLESYVEGREATLTDVSDDYALLALQGPAAATILQRLTQTDLERIGYYRFARGEVASAEALISRTGYTGEDGFELYLAPAEAGRVWRALLERGAGEGLVPAGLGARDTLRLEAGMALYGHEIDDTVNPWEAGLGWVIKLEKGDFIGREALVRAREKGPERHLTGLELTGRGIARQGYSVLHGGRAVGAVTSGTWSPFFERAVAMAYLPVDLKAPETEVEVEVRGRGVAARVTKLPFYRRGG
jgi:aminomethyltransferase